MDRKRRLMENNNGWPLRSQLLDGAPFRLPLTNTAVPANAAPGTTATFTRATTKTWPNNDGYLVTGVSGEIGFVGARRVDNLIRLGAAQSSTLAVAANVTMTLPAGAYQFSMGAGTGRVTFSGTGGATGTLDAVTTGRVHVAKTITAGTLIVTASVATLVDIQVVSMVAETDQTTIREYVSVGVASSPYYHGSMVDGVKCFATDINGAAIPSTTLLGYSAEGARTNLCTKSQEFDAWNTSVAGAGSVPVVTANAAVAPDGTTTADKVVFAAPGAGDISQIYSASFTAAASTTHTSAVYVKAFAAGDVGKQLLTRHVGAAAYTVLTLTAEWQRLGSSEASGAGGARSFEILLRPSEGGSSGTVSCYLWGAQVELGSFASSYIATTTVAVTRNADVEAVSTSGNIAAAAGSVYLEYTPTHSPSGTIAFWGTYVDASNYTAILHDATNLIFRKRIAGVNYDATIANAFVSGTTYKVCATWGTAGTSITLNGTEGTPHANTTAAQIAATMQWGADGNSLQQPFASIRNCRDWLRQLSASERAAVTA